MACRLLPNAREGALIRGEGTPPTSPRWSKILSISCCGREKVSGFDLSAFAVGFGIKKTCFQLLLPVDFLLLSLGVWWFYAPKSCCNFIVFARRMLMISSNGNGSLVSCFCFSCATINKIGQGYQQFTGSRRWIVLMGKHGAWSWGQCWVEWDVFCFHCSRSVKRKCNNIGNTGVSLV